MTTADDILSRLAGHDSKRPANAADVAALVGGDEIHYWAALEQLQRERRINTAHIQRRGDPAPWLAIWPTGLPARMDSWRDLNVRGHFAIHQTTPTPQRLPQSPAKRRQIEEDTVKTDNRNCTPRRDRIAELVRGRTLENGLTFGDVSADLGISVEGVRYLVKTMIGGLRVARGRLPGHAADRLYDPYAGMAGTVTAAEPIDDSDSIPTPLADAIADMEVDELPHETIAAAAAAVPPRDPARIEFALWDDGRLSIYDGDDLVMLPPSDTARLARLLGVPAHPLAERVPA